MHPVYLHGGLRQTWKSGGQGWRLWGARRRGIIRALVEAPFL
jgi:hypothetical protein